MQQQRILEWLKRVPFVPFDIKTSDGRVYAVDHPEFVSQSRDGATITYWTDDDRILFLGAHHVVALEMMNRPTSAAG